MSLVGPIFGISSAILLVASGPSYFLATIKGKMKPQRATWLIWSILSLTALISQLDLGATWSVVFLAVDCLGNIGMFLLSIKFGVGGWKLLDKLALAVAALGVVVSLVSDKPTVALVGVIVASAAGAALTIRKAYVDPGSEDPVAWSLVGLSAVLGLVAVGRFDLSLWLYPIYVIVENFGVVVGQRLGDVRIRSSISNN